MKHTDKAAKHHEKYGVDVLINDLHKNPHCEHGPTVLFERFSAGKNSKFYACSACRTRKLCTFYQPFGSIKSKMSLVKSNEKCSNIERNIFQVSDLSKYFFCKSCVGVYSVSEFKNHSKCKKMTKLDEKKVRFPTKMLTPKENSKFEAQYLFTDKSTADISQLLKGIHGKKVLCIGCPRIYEYLKTDEKKKSLLCLLLDIDERFYSFYSAEEFLKYNLFNHHFFDGNDALNTYKSFIKGNEKLVVLMDPPFGGRIELIANTLNFIEKDWKQVNNLGDSSTLSEMLVLPYFLERSLTKSLPSFSMLEYQVDYDNHPLHNKGSKGMKNGSAVRIFVNSSTKLFKLPKDEGYKLCTICDRWVHKNNEHCSKCQGCMSKDGNTYKHCDECQKCVKPAWVHCTTCKSCLPNVHVCGDARVASKCHICGNENHKRMDCPKRKMQPIENTRKNKKRKIN